MHRPARDVAKVGVYMFICTSKCFKIYLSSFDRMQSGHQKKKNTEKGQENF